MESDSNIALEKLRDYLIEDVHYRHVGDYLVKTGILSQKEDYRIMQLIGKSKISTLLNIIRTREGAARELINAMNQPATMRIYEDLIRKMENICPTTPVSAKSFTKFTYLENNESTGKKVDRDKIVEKRHFNEIVRILKQEPANWKKFYEFLNIDPVEMFSTTQKLGKGTIGIAEAYRDALDAWKQQYSRKATFAFLEDSLRSMGWDSAADEITERSWD